MAKKIRTGVWAIKAFLQEEGIIQRTQRVREFREQPQQVSEFWTEVNVKERRANLKPPAEPYVFTTKKLPWL